MRSKSSTPFYGGKLDFIPFDGHRVEGTFWSDERTINFDYYNVDGTGTDRKGIITGGVKEGREVNKIGGKNWIVQYTGQFTDFFTLSGAYGENRYRRSDVIAGGELAGPIVQTQLAFDANGNKTTALSTIAGVPVSPTDGSDLRKVMRLDADLYVNLLGQHHFRFGFDREDLSVTENTFYTGDRIYRFTGTYIRARTYLNEGFFKTKQTAFYAQDSWDLLNDRLNLQLGVRNDRFENFSITGAKYVDLKNQWAPRLGASFDVFGDKLTKIQAFWGRYYLPVATNTNIRLGGAETFYEQRFAYAPGVVGSNYDANGIPIGQQFTASGAPVLGSLTAANGLNCPDFGPGAGQKCRTVFSDGIAGPTDTLVSSNLKPMYQDEFIIGLTHRMDDWTFGIRYINRRLKQTLEDVAIDAAVNKYCESKGLDCTTSSGSPIWSGFHQYVLANPGEPITVRLDGDPSKPGTTGVVTLSAADLGYPRASRKYDSVEFTASKAFNGTWGFDFSYTYQKLRGNYEGSVKSDNNQDDAGLTQDFDQPGLVDGSNGILANNREHTFKLFGSWKPVDWLRIGGNLTVQSPRSFSCVGVHPSDFFASQYGAASFYCANPKGNGGSTDSVLVPRGTAFKSDWNKNLDLGFQFELGEALANSNFRVDVFNVFNWKSKTDFVEFGETDSGAIRSDYRLPTGFQAPRQVRFTWTMRFGGKNGE
ncbi:TonB-dependent receptor [Novosphingobium sp. CCH12-A3]|uniref:TonB-dependent receptor n=1 Tax=Novosphingobium sp. CCH12-A3 TaxID=1768752 RepID=UPI000784B83E|nr:TonB-dependent receptor [Novosphingobium sp. CCH12-A3]